MEQIMYSIFYLFGFLLLAFLVGALTTSEKNEDLGKTVRRGIFILLLLGLTWLAWRFLKENPEALNEWRESFSSNL